MREQTWSDKEIVVVDEASTDDTLAMLQKDFPEARVVRHESARGPSAARSPVSGLPATVNSTTPT